MRSGDAAADELVEHVATLRAHAGADVFGHVCALLECLERSYKRALVHVPPEELQLLQGATRQVIAMRECLTSQIEGLSPHI